MPVPARLTSRPAAGLIGRSAELASLAQAIKRTSAGDGREVVIVSGEAGLGKTSLVAEVARTAFESGTCVLFGHAEEDLATPYGLFAEAFTHLVTHAAEDDLRAYVADCGSDLARIVPVLTRRLPELDAPTSSDAETERYLLFGAVVGLLRHVSGERPVVLVLDDLQWADSASLQLLRHLLAEDPALRLLVLGTYRDTEVAAGHPLIETLAALWRMDRVARVDLQGLDDGGVVDLLAATAGHDLDGAGIGLAHALYRETDGNPFFLAEVLRHLVETGDLYRDDATGRWVSDLALEELRLPDSVREVVGARVARLGPSAARILGTAAVIGRDFDLELLARATESTEDTVLDLLEAAESAALVREPATVSGRFSFTHALIQRTLYQDLSANRRARTHERVAESLEDLCHGRPGDRVGELAHHWAQAMRPADAAKAVEYAGRAGDAALAALAPAEAVRWYTQALDLLGADGDPRHRARLLVDLGQAEEDDGRPEYRDTLLIAARLADACDDVDLLVRAALANTRGFQSSIGDADQDRLAIIDLALHRLGDRDAGSRARLLALSAVEQTYTSPLAERLELSEQARELAQASGDPLARVQVAALSWMSIFVPWTIEERMASTAAGVAAAGELADPGWSCVALTQRRSLLLEICDRDGADEMTVVLDSLIERLPPVYRWTYAFEHAYLALVDGDIERGERFAEQALNTGLEHGQPDAFEMYGAQLGNVREAQGRFGELVPLVEATLQETPGLTIYRAVLAQACAEAGELDRTRELLDRAREAAFATGEDTGWLNAHMQWAKAAVAIGDLDTAQAMWERLAPFRDLAIFTLATISPVAGHYVGRLEHLLGHLDDANTSFARAHELHQRLRAPQFVARTEVRWAEMLVDRNRPGDRARARELAQTARTASAGRPGWDWIERDAVAVSDRAT